MSAYPRPKRPKKRFKPDQIKDITSSYISGESLLSLAVRYECSSNPIRRILIEHDIPIKTKHGHNRAAIKDGTKFCSINKHWVELDNFYIRKNPHDTDYVTRSHACKDCMQEKWHTDWSKYIAKKYKITVETYEAMVVNQNNLCAICNQSETRMLGDKPQRLAVDHDHATGKVRGLLCNQCNSMIGFARENLDILNSAKEYLHAYTYSYAHINDNSHLTTNKGTIMKTLKQLAQDAIDVQNACNVQGVAISFGKALESLREIARTEGWNSTDAINHHPICVMWSSKIASLTGSESGLEFSRAYDFCCKETQDK